MQEYAKPEVKFGIIREMTARDNNMLNISWLCELAGVSRSGYYKWLDNEPKRQERENCDKADFALILAAYQFRGYDKGARGIYMRLLHQSPPIVMNIKKCYLCTILDAYTKQILSYVASDSFEIDFVLETINLLIKNHGVSLTAETLINSDQGSHYTSYSFIQIVKDFNLRQSMSRKANCWDNAPQESFYGHMKDEIDISKCQDFTAVKVIIDDWMDYYNNDRYQWDLARLSPNEFAEYTRTEKYPLSVYTPPENSSP